MRIHSHMRESLKDHVLEQVLDDEKFKGYMLRAPKGGRSMSTLIMFTPEGIIITGDLCPRVGTRGVVSDLGYGLGWFSGRLSGDYLCEKFFQHGWHQDLAVAELRAMILDIREGTYDEYGWVGELQEVSEERGGQHDELVRSRRTLQDLKASNEADRDEQIKDTQEEITDLWKELRPLREKVVALRQDLMKKLDELLRDVDNGNLDHLSFSYAYHEINADAETTPGWGYPPADGAWLCVIQQKFAELYTAAAPAGVAE